VLDIPSGGGQLRPWLGEREVVAAETTAVFHEVAGQRTDLTAVRVPSLHATGIQRSFDAVVSLAGLHHVQDRRPIYREFRRLVRPGGRLGIIEVEPGSGPAAFLNGFVHTHSSMGHDGLFLSADDCEALREAGFPDVSVERVDTDWHFDSLEDVAAFTRDLFGIDQATHEQTLEALRDLVGLRGTTVAWHLNRFLAR